MDFVPEESAINTEAIEVSRAATAGRQCAAGLLLSCWGRMLWQRQAAVAAIISWLHWFLVVVCCAMRSHVCEAVGSMVLL